MTNAAGDKGAIASEAEEEALATLLRVCLRPRAGASDDAFGALALLAVCESVAALGSTRSAEVIRETAWRAHREQAASRQGRAASVRAA